MIIESDAKKTGKMFCGRMILLSILDSQTNNIPSSTQNFRSIAVLHVSVTFFVPKLWLF